MAAHVDRASSSLDVVPDPGLRTMYRHAHDLLTLARIRTVMRDGYTGEPLSPLLPPIVIPKPSSLMPIYVAISLGAMLLGGAIAVAITVARPTVDNSTLISTVMTGLGVATLQALNFIKSSQAVAVATQTTAQVEVLHKSVNSGFEEFARLIRAEAHAAGIKESEEKQFDAAAVEARIDTAVREGIAAAMVSAAPAVVQPVAPAAVQPVDITTIQPAATTDLAKGIASALADDPPAGAGIAQAIASAITDDPKPMKDAMAGANEPDREEK